MIMNIVFIQRYSNDLTSSNGSYRRSSTKIQKIEKKNLYLNLTRYRGQISSGTYDKLKPFGIAIHGCIDG